MLTLHPPGISSGGYGDDKVAVVTLVIILTVTMHRKNVLLKLKEIENDLKFAE